MFDRVKEIILNIELVESSEDSPARSAELSKLYKKMSELNYKWSNFEKRWILKED